MKLHAAEAMGVVGSQFLVLMILAVGSQTQIFPTVIALIAVFVVNQVRRPVTGHVEPSESIGAVRPPVESDGPVAVIAHTASCVPGLMIAAPSAPRERASLGIVMKKFAQALRGKIVRSHEALPLLIGQRPACVDSTCGPRYFIAQP